MFEAEILDINQYVEYDLGLARGVKRGSMLLVSDDRTVDPSIPGA
jgi:hypothetical protein